MPAAAQAPPLLAEADVEIAQVVYGGDGLARRDGKAVFVPFTLPGERARVAIEEQRAGYDRARLVTLETPSPRRTQPGCDYFGRCGGCQWQHAAPEYQVELKAGILRETLRRTGGIDWQGEIQVHSGPAWEYRNRVRLRLSHAAAGPRLAYFARDSHALVAVDHCPISAPALQAALAAVASLPPPPTTLQEIELMADATGEHLWAELAAVGSSGAAERAYARAMMEALPHCVSVTLHSSSGRETVAGTGGFEYQVGDYRYWVGEGAFFQANRFLMEELVGVVTAVTDAHPAGSPPSGAVDADGAAAGADGGGRCMDLFSGVGLFALPLAARFASVSAIENDPAACASLRRNARAEPRVRVREMPAQEFVARWSGPLDLVVVDPPRAGLGTAMVEAIAAARPRWLHYVSCDPATLARDLKQLLAAAPYALDELHLFDLFPQTFHLESVCKLRLAGA